MAPRGAYSVRDNFEISCGWAAMCVGVAAVKAWGWRSGGRARRRPKSSWQRTPRRCRVGDRGTCKVRGGPWARSWGRGWHPRSQSRVACVPCPPSPSPPCRHSHLRPPNLASPFQPGPTPQFHPRPHRGRRAFFARRARPTLAAHPPPRAPRPARCLPPPSPPPCLRLCGSPQ